jgi:hypothetical protein
LPTVPYTFGGFPTYLYSLTCETFFCWYCCRYAYGGDAAASALSHNDIANKTRRTPKKKEEEGSSRRSYDYVDGNNNKDMDWRGREGKGREKDDGMTTVVHNMGNICAYLPAMMMWIQQQRHSRHPGVGSW